ncbi:MAG: response regulator [Candidatus Acidiferrales bacterium]
MSMSTLSSAGTLANSASANSSASSSKSAFDSKSGVERRRRKRAKISAQVHVRAGAGMEIIEEICKSVDVSRDGLLFVSARAGFAKGQQLAVTFPYSGAAAALNTPQDAEIVRILPGEGGKFQIAVQFLSAKSDAKSERKRPGGAFEGGPGDTPAPAAPDAKQQSLVLAIEPDQRSADMMRALLSQDGYTVTIVPTAQAALDILRTSVPAVFIAEVESADMSGHDLCLIIKRNDRLARVPVILLTRSAQPADYASSHQLGAVVCMAKPFKPERLRNVVRLVAPPPKLNGGSAYGGSRVSASSIDRAL